MYMRSRVLARLLAAAFLAMWAWSVAQEPEAVSALAEDIYRVERQVEHALWQFDHAAVDFVTDGVQNVSEGLCNVPPEMAVVQEIDPEAVDGGFLIPGPVRACEPPASEAEAVVDREAP
jgi:hypothetical protein